MFGGQFSDSSVDPFFAAHDQQMQRMNRMAMNPFGSMNPMIGFGPSSMSAIQGVGQQQQRDYQRRGDRRLHHQPSSGGGTMMPMMGGDMFGHMNQMMENMNGMMSNMRTQMAQVQNDPNSQCFSQTSFMSYSSNGQGQPRIYQASTSTKQAPGGIRETQKTVRDSQKGVAKMLVGRQIGDRKHVITKQKNLRTGDIEENHEYANLDEEEAEDFHNEFTSNRHRQPYHQIRGRRQHSAAIRYRERD